MIVGKINLSIYDGVNRTRSYQAAIVSFVYNSEQSEEEKRKSLKSYVFYTSVTFALPIPVLASRMLSRSLNATTANFENMRGVWSIVSALELRTEYPLTEPIDQNCKCSFFNFASLMDSFYD